MRICITGGSGFIGNHLVKRLKQEGHFVRVIDIKYNDYEKSIADENWLLDMRSRDNALKALENVDQAYFLGADMGGVGFMHGKDAHMLQNNLTIDINSIEAARFNGVNDILFTSSACIYPLDVQSYSTKPLTEDLIGQGDPGDGYGFEKLTQVMLCKYYKQDYNMNTHVVVIHNCYGTNHYFSGGREKSPAAICRKVIEATDIVDIWGTGKQLRSYCYIDDTVEGLIRTMASTYNGPINIGRNDPITIEDFTKMIIKLSGKDLKINYIDGPVGVDGRNSDNTLCQEVLGWQPSIPLEVGIKKTYDWIKSQIEKT